jgi:hypothetical protein
MNLFKKLCDYFTIVVTVIQFVMLVPVLYAYSKGYIGVNLVVPILVFLVAASMLYCMYVAYGTPRVYVAHSEQDSVRSIKQIYKRVNSFLDRNKLVQLYEANLETKSPGGTILDDDKQMATRNSGSTVRWKMVILKTPDKEGWIDSWKNAIWKKNDDCQLYVVGSERPIEDFHLLNFMAIPDIGETYIGYGHYQGFQGGGIRIRDKRISRELKGVIDNWSKIGKEELRSP